MLDALHSPLLARRSALLARLALALAAAWLMLMLLRFAWLAATGPTSTAPAAALPASPTAPQPDAASAQSIAAWHLFGNGQGPIDLAALAQTAPATGLKLILRGTLNENAPEGGVAIIADESGNDRAYRVGDGLPGDAKLEGIYAGRVLLSRQGVSESLSLPQDAAAASNAPVPGAVPNRTATPRNTAAPTPFVTPVISPGIPSFDTIRAATGTDPMELAKQVQILPVMENGRMAGVRLSVGRDSDLLSRAGLHPNDIVTAVNGIPLDGPQRSTELIDALKDARSAQLTVRRDGKDTQLTIGLR